MKISYPSQTIKRYKFDTVFNPGITGVYGDEIDNYFTNSMSSILTSTHQTL
jgi:hypothetical protein